MQQITVWLQLHNKVDLVTLPKMHDRNYQMLNVHPLVRPSR